MVVQLTSIPLGAISKIGDVKADLPKKVLELFLLYCYCKAFNCCRLLIAEVLFAFSIVYLFLTKSAATAEVPN
jgi:hypothetical protein